MSLLEMNEVRAGYGGVDILQGVNIAVDRGEIGVIVGPNGAGKSTTLKVLFGLLPVSAGSVSFDGQVITNNPPEALVRIGLSYVPQEFNVFPAMTVEENLEVGAHIRRTNYRYRIDEIYDLFPPLRNKRTQPAGELSGGQRQMVAMGRALMTEPKLLVLDEPTAGLSPAYTDEIFSHIQNVNASGVCILMVEQNARPALAIADRGFVLATGKNAFSGTGASLLADPAVARSFLGIEEDAAGVEEVAG